MPVMAALSTWMPHLYSAFWIALAPLALLMFVVPLTVVDQLYIGSSSAFVFVSLWTVLQTLTAWWWSLAEKGRGVVVSGLVSPVGPYVRAAKIAYLIPAYLNNEACILNDTISSYCNIEYHGDILVLVVFNSRGDMSEAEFDLLLKWDGVVRGKSGNIRISIVKNYESTSKADNVNFGLRLIPADVDYTAIMDADHQPAPNSASVATQIMRSEGYDVLQGACTIRNQDNFLSKMISVEFEHMYCVAHQGRFRVFDLGLFVGSNGYWKSSVLKEIGMDNTMLTEDVDSSVRALLAGYKIGHSASIVSSELSPLNRDVLQTQRLRWAQGWAEVSTKHVWNCMTSSHLSLRQKLGFVHILGWRELFPYMTFWPLLCVVGHVWRSGTLELVLLWEVLGGMVLIFGFTRVAAAYALSRGSIGSNIGAFFLFSIWGMVFDVYLNYLQVCAHGRSLLKANAWVATVREKTPSGNRVC